MHNTTNPWAHGDYDADHYARIATVSRADANIAIPRCESPLTAQMNIHAPNHSDMYSTQKPMNKHSTPLKSSGSKTKHDRFPVKISKQQIPSTSNLPQRSHGPRQLANPPLAAPPRQFIEFGEKDDQVHNTAPVCTLQLIFTKTIRYSFNVDCRPKSFGSPPVASFPIKIK